jgi:hypothetical protein
MSIFLNVEGFVGQKSIAPFLNWPCDEEQQICPVQLLLLWKEKVVAKPLQAIGWDRHGLLLQRESEEFRDVSLDLLQQPCIHPMVHKMEVSPILTCRSKLRDLLLREVRIFFFD